MTLDYVVIRRPILILKGYSASKKILLGFIDSFNSKGLKMSNNALAEILDVRPSYISDLFVELESSGDIEIHNRQSRHRVIHLRQKSKVGNALLTTKVGSKKVLLTTFSPSTYDKSRNIIKRTKEKEHTFVFFDDLWKVYPKKVSRPEAEKVFRKLNPDRGLFEKILAAVEQHKQLEQWQKENGKYIPKLSTWLKNRRWEDELPGLDGCGIVQTQDTDPEEAERLRIEMLKVGA